MRILIVGVRNPPETFIVRKIKGLIASGFEVCAASSDLVPKNSGQPGLQWIQLPPSTGRLARLRSFLGHGLKGMVIRPHSVAKALESVSGRSRKWEYADIASRLAGCRPDLVHFEWNLAAVQYLPLFDWLGAPVVISCRGSQVLVIPHTGEKKEETAEISRTFAKAAAVHCVSESVKQAAIELGLEPQKGIVIRPAVDPDFFAPPPQKSSTDTLRLITSSTPGWVKGPEYALMAVRKLLDAGLKVKFQWIGGGSKADQQRLLYTIHDLGLVDIMELPGKQSPEQVRDSLQQADVFLLSSVSEGISNAALEAMSCGIPVVTSDCGGMREVITNGMDGFITPLRDPAAMAEAMCRLATHPELREQMGLAAREKILGNFTLDIQQHQWQALYKSVIQKKRTAPAEAAAVSLLSQ